MPGFEHLMLCILVGRCFETYRLFTHMLCSGADVAVRLQAAHALNTVLCSACVEDVRVFAPLAIDACTGLMATLEMCHNDEALLWLLMTLRRVLHCSSACTTAVMPALGKLWERAQREPLFFDSGRHGSIGGAHAGGDGRACGRRLPCG